MKKRTIRALAVALASVMTLSSGLMTVAAAPADTAAELTAFEQEFMNPDDDARPFVRWWIAPGRMEEKVVRETIKNFADAGYSGVELQTLELAKKDIVLNDDKWNEEMKWILKAGIEYGVQIDFTITQLWPVSNPYIKDIDDEQLEQSIYEGSAAFTASTDAMTYKAESFVLPTARAFVKNRAFNLIGISAVKVEDGKLNSDTAVNVLDEAQAAEFDAETGALSWTAPSEGEWKVFYYYRQTTGKSTMMVGHYVIDHMGAEATKSVLKTYDDAFERDPELKSLMQQNAGSIFGDSFELSSNLWTPKMIEEFEARRGYDLTPYLPALFNDMGAIDSRVQNDYYQTMTDLLSENHMSAITNWAHENGMTCRYQAYSSAGSLLFEITEPSLAVDIIEAEAYAMGNGNAPDTFRQLSGAVHMRGDELYTAETSEMGNDAWQISWTGNNTSNGTEFSNPGFMYQAYRLFAAGVNKHVFHGATYQLTDNSDWYSMWGMSFAPAVVWPGVSAMAGMSYGNEWDNKTPMWENVDISVDALSRYQMVLQQGEADIDLAVYRSNYGKGQTYRESTALELNGYTYDYVTEAVLDLDTAKVTDGVLAADTASYKALIIEPTASGNIPQINIDTMQKIVEYAKAGLPVVIVGAAPSEVKSFSGANSANSLWGEDLKLSDVLLPKLQKYDNVKTAADREALVKVLAELGVTPDVQATEAVDLLSQHRKTENADLYYLFNNTAETMTQTVTLKGEGTPYLLDAWSGKVTPIAEYTVGEGTVTIEIELAAEDAMMVALAGNGFCSAVKADNYVVATTADAAVYADADIAVRTTEAGDYEVELNDGTKVTVTAEAAEKAQTLGGWSMVLHQWTEDTTLPDKSFERVYTSKIVDKEYDLTEKGLVAWSEIDPELARAAGVAEYTAKFNLEKGWAEGQGAYIDFAYYSDIARLTVNGTEVPMNQIAESTDIGEYVVAGENTITVEVSSNMANVTQNGTQHVFGIVGDVVVTPYIQTALKVENEPEVEDKPGTDEKTEMPFTDVPEGYKFYDEILWAYENGITAGKTATLFQPTGECTRGQVVTFIWREAGCPEPTITKNPFTDVASTSPFYKAILWAYEKGITTGKTATTFQPDVTVNREQVVTFLWRAEGKPAPKADNNFTDVADNTPFTDAISWAAEEGITKGKTATTFQPKSACIREQVVTFLYRVNN